MSDKFDEWAKLIFPVCWVCPKCDHENDRSEWVDDKPPPVIVCGGCLEKFFPINEQEGDHE